MRDLSLRRLLHPWVRALETRVHPLRYLFLEITQRCNLRCRHCGSDCTAAPRTDELSTEEWLRFLDGLGERARRDRLALVVTGGEPLCHPELPRLLEGLRRNGLTFGLVSNGQALTQARLGQLLAAGLSSLTISLDGLEASHDWLRGVPGSFQRATAAIRAAVAAGLPFFDVVTCANPRNLAELPRVHELLRELGVRRWRLFSIFPRGRAASDPELLLCGEQLRSLLGFIAAERRARAPDDLRPSFCCEGYLPWSVDAGVCDEPYFCRAGISIASVLCDGAISACPNISRGLVQGNIRTDDLLEVWETRFARLRQRDWMQTGPCRGCGEWGRCRGNSLHLWDEAAGRTACCTFERVSGTSCTG